MQEPRGQHVELSADDARLLDALMESGFEPDALEALSADDRARVDRLMSVFGLMGDYPVDDASESLVHATIARIDQADREREERMTLSAASTPGRGFRFMRLPDFVTVAAVLLIAASVALPVMSNIRRQSIDLKCENNLRQLGYAFSTYAADNNGLMPAAQQAGIAHPWNSFSNIMNLNPLTHGEYCSADCLHCPGNKKPTGPSYSYQWQSGEGRRWEGGQGMLIVMGDRNPLVDAARQGLTTPPPGSMSLNHGGRGQNVLRSDGTTMFLNNPVVGRGDNIWLPNGAKKLMNGVSPSDESDVFLLH
ncbi:MAG: hypothetical protein AAF432_15015 [Planctomycetota bacterium]